MPSGGEVPEGGSPRSSFESLGSRVRWFVTTTGSPRARRPSDAVSLVVGLLLVVVGVFGAEHAGSMEQALVEVMESLPGWIQELFGVSYAIGAAYAVTLFLTVLIERRRRKGVLRDLSIAAGAAALLAIALLRLIQDQWPTLLLEVRSAEAAAEFPPFRVAVVTAILATASPHVIRPLQRLGWLVITMVAVSGLGLGLGLASDVLGAVGLGMAAAGAVLLAFGSPRGYPDVAEVARGLDQLGVEYSELRIAPSQTWGARLLLANGSSGEQIVVKAFGRDATESQFLGKVWRSAWFRDAGPAISYSRIQGVEHEALLTLLAGRQGVGTARILAAGEPGEDMALLVVEQPGRPMAEMDPHTISDETLIAVWNDVARMHEASISHGRLSTDTVHVADGAHVISDFSGGSFAAPEMRIQSDVAELIFSLTALVGVDRACRSAMAGLGRGRLVAALPYLQLPAVSPRSRKQTEDPRSS